MATKKIKRKIPEVNDNNFCYFIRCQYRKDAYKQRPFFKFVHDGEIMEVNGRYKCQWKNNSGKTMIDSCVYASSNTGMMTDEETEQLDPLLRRSHLAIIAALVKHNLAQRKKK